MTGSGQNILKRNRRSLLNLFFICMTPFLLFVNCALPDFEEFSDEATAGAAGQKVGLPQEVSIGSEEITLTWDPPPSSIKEYKVLYRDHGTTGWTEKAVIPAVPSPEYTFYHADLGNGAFDFAVLAVDNDDNESAIHSSLDGTASPSSGWYIIWNR